MSYDVSAVIDTGGPEKHHIELSFADTHPAFDTDGMAGTAMLTPSGYSRIGNYTSNVSGMWTRCLTAVMHDHDAARKWDEPAISGHGQPIVRYSGASPKSGGRLLDGCEWNEMPQ